MKPGALAGGAAFKDRGLPFWRGMIDPQIEAPPPKQVADPSFFVRGQYHKGNGFRLDHSEMRNAQLPYAQNLKQHGLKTMINLVRFVDPQYTRHDVPQRPQQKASA